MCVCVLSKYVEEGESMSMVINRRKWLGLSGECAAIISVVIKEGGVRQSCH